MPDGPAYWVLVIGYMQERPAYNRNGYMQQSNLTNPSQNVGSVYSCLY